MKIYDHQKIEKYWKTYWDKNKTFAFDIDDSKPKKYILDMFLYPSNQRLHVGHPRGYTATDIYARMHHLLNYNVLHPVGFDAFGLPAEQYAKQTNKSPETFTNKNIENFSIQLKSLGFFYDFDRRIQTTDPAYYKWTQWIFKQLYLNDLAEIKEQEVNYCPKLHTVLANEEIYIKNHQVLSERGDFLVEKRKLKQWTLKIVNYAEELLEGLKNLDWPIGTKKLQEKWIGKKEGYDVILKINHINIAIFITNPNLFLEKGKLYISIHHPLINKIVKKEYQTKFAKYYKKYHNLSYFLNIKNIHDCKKMLIGEWCNPFLNNEKMEVYVVNHPLSHKKTEKIQYIVKNIHQKKLSFNDLKQKLKIQKNIHYKLQNWIFSRQRYWGEPFPVVYTKNNQIALVSDDQLPITLPKIYKTFEREEKNEIIPPLAFYKDWATYYDPNLKETVRRDFNTMPQWAGSCWYYIGYLLRTLSKERYLPLNNAKAKNYIDRYLPVDLYIGGQEHAVSHLLYARFWHLFLYKINLTSHKEPFQKLVHQGMILDHNMKKMSKSKNNVVNPDEIIKKYGADSLRFYEMFLGPINSNLPWKNANVKAAHNFITKFFKFASTVETTKDNQNANILEQRNKFVKQVTLNFKSLRFNAALSAFMIFFNTIKNEKKICKSFLEDFVIMFSCVCPFVSEELWKHLGHPKSIYSQEKNIWPTVLEDKKEAEVIILVQNGKKVINKFVLKENKASEENIFKIIYENDFNLKNQKYIVNKRNNIVIVNFIKMK